MKTLLRRFFQKELDENYREGFENGQKSSESQRLEEIRQEKAETMRLEKEIEQLKKLKINLSEGEVTIESLDDVTEYDLGLIKGIIHDDGYRALRRFTLRQAVGYYERAGSSDREEAYIFAKVAKYLVDYVNTIDNLAPTTEPSPDEE